MIAIATPSRDMVHSTYVFDLVQLMQRTKQDITYPLVQGTIVQAVRQAIAEAALAAGVSHILFIDSDMRFPPDTLDRLVAHDKPFVAANCRHRVLADRCTAFKDGQPVSSEGRTGLESVDSVGFGVALIDAAVLRRMNRPYFGVPWDGSKFVGEDVYFCHHAREAGFAIWIDHDLSKDVRHTGAVELGFQKS